MRKNLLLVLTSLCVGIVALAGCSDSKARRAGQNIQEQISKAQRRCEAALTLMAGTPYKIGQQFAPLTKVQPGPVKEDQIQAYVPEVLNPDIEKILDQARSDLESALRDGDAAAAEDKALATVMLGRIASLKGQYYLTLTLAAQNKARVALSNTDHMLHAVRAQRDLIAEFDVAGALGDTDVAQWLNEARQEVAATQEKISQARQGLERFALDKDALQKQYDARMAEGENFRIESRNAEGRARLDLFDKYQAKQEEANQVQYRIADLESKTEAAQSELRGLTLSLASAEARVGVGEDILKGRAEQRTADVGQRTQLLTVLAAAREEAGKRLAAVAAACNEAKKTQAQTAQAYKLALQRAEEAGRLGEKARDPGTLCERAGTCMAEGDLYIRSLSLQADNQRAIAAVTKLWGEPQPTTLPDSVKDLAEYVPAADEVRAAAEKLFRDAEELYRQASAHARGDNALLYQEALKSAQAAQAQLTRS